MMTCHGLLLPGIVRFGLLLLLAGSTLSPRAEGISDHKIKIILVGDSTVNDGSGWGTGFKQYLTGNIICINAAANGRSSKSYLAEGRWKKALALKGDYYLIQFGHNDEPGKGPERETDPDTTYFQNMARYVNDARAIGATPVLVTSLTRRIFDATGRLKPSLVPYVEAVKRLASMKHVPLVDLHARSVELCDQLGPEQTAKFNAVAKGRPDTTHLNAAGSVVFAGLVVEELRKAVPALAPYLRTKPLTSATATPISDVGKIQAKQPVTGKPLTLEGAAGLSRDRLGYILANPRKTLEKLDIL